MNARIMNCATGAMVYLGLLGCGMEPRAEEMTSSRSMEVKGTPGARAETAGNNLSLPVIWSDNQPLALRNACEANCFLGAVTEVDGVPIYHQQDPLNQWKADEITPTGPVVVKHVDWGDNLESKPWPISSRVRVETVLWTEIESAATGYAMYYVSGQGTDEMWGTDTSTYPSPVATVYAECARLIIQQLPTASNSAKPCDGANALSLTWNDEFGWQEVKDEAETLPTVADGKAWEGGEGPSGYSAEVNVSGKLIYGYNWKVGSTPGCYRITFALSALCETSGLALNTSFANDANFDPLPPLPPLAEDPPAAAAESEEGEPNGGIPGFKYEHNLTYIDVPIIARSGGGSGGGKKGGGGPGGPG